MADKWIVGVGLTRGIGLEFAKKLNEQGYKIIHLGRKAIGFEKEHLWWDLLNPVADNPIGELHRIMFGKHVYGFFYSAGVMPILELNEADKMQKRLFWQSQSEAMRVNYFACAELIEEIIPFLFSPEDLPEEKFVPFIAHISSLAALDPFPGLELYGASKLAALKYFNWLAKRFAQQQLNCLSIHPGVVLTDMVLNIMKNERKDHPLVKMFNQMNAQKKFMSPVEAASKIFDFIIHESELKISSHGKLFLADKFQIV